MTNPMLDQSRWTACSCPTCRERRDARSRALLAECLREADLTVTYRREG